MALGDFIGDAKTDVAATTGNSAGGQILLFPGSAEGLGDPVSLDTNAIGNPNDMHLASGDLNGDGKADLATSHQLGIDVLLANGEGTFLSATLVNMPGTVAVEVADLDGDNWPDLVAGTSAGPVLLSGKGDGTFNPPSPIGTGAQHDLEVGDFIGDDRLDVAGAYGSTVTIYRQVDAGFDTETLNLSSSVWSVAIADFNSDAGNDLALASGHNNGSIHVYPQNADGELASSVVHSANNNPQGLVAADVDGGGAADLVVAHGLGSIVGVFMQESGRLRSEAAYAIRGTVAYRPGSVAVGNVVGDSSADIVVAEGDSLSVLEGLPPEPTNTQKVPYTVWSDTSGPLLDGMGGWLAVVTDPARYELQLPVHYAHSQISWFANRQALSMVTLVTDPAGKRAKFTIIDEAGSPKEVEVPFQWVEGGFYLPLVHRLGDGSWGAWVYDWADRDRGNEAWTFIGQLSAPGHTKLSPVSVTMSFWYGGEGTDCTEYPRSDVMRYPPIGMVGGTARVADYHLNNQAGPGCSVSTSLELNTWARYRMGAERHKDATPEIIVIPPSGS